MRIFPALVLALALGASPSPFARAQGLLGADASTSPPATRAAPWDRLPAAVQRDLTRVLRAQLEQGLAAHNHSGLLGEWRAAGETVPWPRYFFEAGMTAAGRRGLLTMHAKLADEGLWPLIGALGWIDRTGDTGFMFVPGVEDIAADLKRAGFGNYWFADHGSPWGVRSSKAGAELHFRRSTPGKFDLYSVHIDLHNPGASATHGMSLAADAAVALGHWWDDDHNRSETHTPDTIRAAVVADGLPVPEVDNAPYDGLLLTDFLKWETDEDGWFGHLWLKPGELQAGWWTEDEGGRDFTEVERLAPLPFPGGRYVRFQLRYSNGWVRLTVHADGSLRGTWYQAHTGTTRHFEGELESGNVQVP